MSDASSMRSVKTSFRTRSEASAGTASSNISEARRRAALSKLQAEQAQSAAAVKAELARQQAEAEVELARRQAEVTRRQVEAQAAIETHELKQEAERRQLELELFEQEERRCLSAGDAVSFDRGHSVAAVQLASDRGHAVAAVQPAMERGESLQTHARTREWLSQSQMHMRPTDAVSHNISPAPAPLPQHLPAADRLTTPQLSRSQLHTLPADAVPLNISSAPAPPPQHLPAADRLTTPQLPRITLEKFSGSALEWPRWIALFKALVHDRTDLTDIERLTYLQAHLTGPARESVRGLLCDPSLYCTALRELEEEFGDPSRVTQATMKKLLTARPVRDGDLSALTELSRDLHTAVSVLQCLHFDSDISAATNVTAVAGKLPAGLAWRWGEYIVERGITRPSLLHLDEWLRRQVKAGRVAVNQTSNQTGPRQPKADASTTEDRPRRVFATASAGPLCGRVVNSETAIKSTAAEKRDTCAIVAFGGRHAR